jgi:uncharacterized protein (TIGR02145 family)
MKKFTLLVSAFVLMLTTLSAQEISFSFTGNYLCEHAQLDSILIENITQGGDTTLCWKDTVLTIVLTGIDPVTGEKNGFSVSQNYPNPFETKTDINVFVPERDDLTLCVYDVSGRKIAYYEGTHERGMQQFTFFAGKAQSYILTVSTGEYLQHIQMIQFGEAGSASPHIEYHGSSSTKEQNIKQKSSMGSSFPFPYELEDELSFTAYFSGDFSTITDNPAKSEDYIFDINNVVPAEPGVISGNNNVCKRAAGETYSIEAVDDATSYTWTVPPGASITDGDGTTSITVDFGTGSGDICVTADNACGTSTSSCVTITIPVATAGSNSPVCEGETINLTETGGDADSWSWSGPNGFTSPDQNPTINSATTAASGTYTVTVTDGNGCTNTDSVSVTVKLHEAGTGVTDYDGNTYGSIIINGQEWMTSNLEVTHYSDGNAITLVTDNTAWDNLGDNNTDKAYCWYDNDSATNKDLYGALYTYAAATNGDTSGTDVQGVCPTGWHLPSDAEWTALTDALGGASVAGGKLKATSGWKHGGNGTDDIDFAALPGGSRDDNSGSFDGAGYIGYWWFSTEGNASSAWPRGMLYSSAGVYRYNSNKSNGFSVRCVRD